MNWFAQWVDAIRQSLTDIGVGAAAFIPRIVGGAVILALGYLASRVLERIAVILLKRMGFDHASERVGLTPVLEKGNIHTSPSAIVGRLTFWFVMLTFTVSAVDTLGLDSLSRTIDSFVAYLPNVFGATAIAVIGLLLAGVVRDVVKSGVGSLGMEHAQPLAAALYIVLAIVVGALAVSQLKIETGLINRVIEIVLIAAGASLALTLGWGTRDVAKNIMAGIYARDVYTPGMRLSIKGDSGLVEEVGTVTTRVRSDDDEIIFVPNGELMQTVVKGREQGRVQ
jgi:small-conductance mechanosensitive channel